MERKRQELRECRQGRRGRNNQVYGENENEQQLAGRTCQSLYIFMR